MESERLNAVHITDASIIRGAQEWEELEATDQMDATLNDEGGSEDDERTSTRKW